MLLRPVKKKASELKVEVKRLLAQAETTDAAEDAQCGKGKRGDELAEGWAFGKRRLEGIQRWRNWKPRLKRNMTPGGL